MRHAKSSWKDADLTDFDRPLNSRGEADAPRMGALIKAEGLVPDQIVSSSAVRAYSTAELVAAACDYEGEIHQTQALYHAPPGIYYEILANLNNSVDIAMVVGHNPGIEAFLSKLILTWTSMTTANIGHVEIEISNWDQFREGVKGRLIHFWQPRALIQ